MTCKLGLFKGEKTAAQSAAVFSPPFHYNRCHFESPASLRAASLYNDMGEQ
jgi:hypothetical protein